MNVAKFAVRNPVLVNILMAAILVLGGVSLLELPQELMPQIPFNWAFIITPYPGGSPEEVEDLITIPIEDAIENLEGVDEIISASTEGSSFIHVKFEQSGETKFQKRFLNLKSEVDNVKLPDEAETPRVEDFSVQGMWPVVSIIVSGSLSELEIKKIAERLQDEIEDIPGTAQIALNARDRQVWIEVDPLSLERYRIPMAQVLAALSSSNLNLPSGTARGEREELSVRTVGKIENIADFGKVIIRTTRSGGPIRIEDVAAVKDTFEERRIISRYRGERALFISVSKKTNASSTKVVEAIRQLVDDLKGELPEGVEVVLTGDSTMMISESLTILKKNALFGLAAVLLILYVFIGPVNAILVSIGIPVSFMATFLFMRFAGETINAHSLFALILVLGILVDDAIVIVENCFRHYQLGRDRKSAAIIGTNEVGSPVFAAVATTIAAFLPLALMPGIMGRFMRIIPIVVSLALVASLMEAFIILPSHFAEWTPRRYAPPPSHRWFTRLRAAYTRVLTRFLRRRYIVVGGVLALTAVAASMIPLVGVDLFAGKELSRFWIHVWMPFGTSLNYTDEVMTEIAQKVRANIEQDDVVSIVSTAGLMQAEAKWYIRSDAGQVEVELIPERKRSRSTDEIIESLRKTLAGVAGPMSIEFYRKAGPPVGKGVEAQIIGEDLDELYEIAQYMESRLEGVEGIKDVRDDFSPSKREVRLRVDKEAAARYGLSVEDIAYFVRAAISGIEATTFRERTEEIEVMAIFPERFRKDVDVLTNVRFITPRGEAIPLTRLVRVESAEASPPINHIGGKRTITVSADVDAHVISLVEANRIAKEVFDEIAPLHPGYSLALGGQFKEFTESFHSLTSLFLIGLFIIYCILGWQFGSFILPVIIIFAIPFAFIGAIFGLLVIGAPFSITTLYGMVALAGIAVNDAIVMMSFIRRARKQGLPRWLTLVRAGRVRLRPIILTTATTACGLLPMAIGLGGYSADWGPLASTIVWGILVSTAGTLLVMPCLYTIFADDMAGWFKRRLRRKGGEVQ